MSKIAGITIPEITDDVDAIISRLEEIKMALPKLNTIYTAIFGPYDELKEPTIITPGWNYVVFTDQPLKSDTWEILRVDDVMECGPIRMARYFKIMFHKHIPQMNSIWVDASFTINCDLNKWWGDHFVAPFTCIAHPIRRCVYLEGDACIRHKRANEAEIRQQIDEYARLGVPRSNGLISSGILMRQRKPQVIQFCEEWFNETMKYSTRDQLSFARVSWAMRIHHQFPWDYRHGTEFIWKTHIHRRK